LKSFQVAQLAYDVTVRFPSPGGAGQDEGEREPIIPSSVLRPPSPIRWAKGRVQNIAEGSHASGTSKKMELKLTNVARASLEELRLDYEDFLRQRWLAQWPREAARRAELIAARPATADDVAAWVKDVHGQNGQHGRRREGKLEPKSIQSTVSTKSTYAEISANGALALLAVACSLLDRQLAAQEKAFLEGGGFTERLYRVRRAQRK
jgi:four helix bundle suffix protein